MKSGVERIADERARQIAQEGYSEEHDDIHDDHSLALAAICYAAPEQVYLKKENTIYNQPIQYVFTDAWPWAVRADKRQYTRVVRGGVTVYDPTLDEGKYIRQLEKAGALIAAEIDRLLRAQQSTEEAAER